MRAPLLAALCLAATALLPAASAQEAEADLGEDVQACIDSVVAGWPECAAGEVGCTSTSRCTGAEAATTHGWFRYCFLGGICTPWLPACYQVAIWYTDEMDDPTFSEEPCLMLPLQD